MIIKTIKLIILATFIPTVCWSLEKESKVLNLFDGFYGQSEVPIEITLPNGDGPFPVIITQHGSTRDGQIFVGKKGQTDEHSRRLTERAVTRGFAVIALDAFYNKNLQPTDKRKFPNAETYAKEIRNQIATLNPKLDPKLTFYTGHSYGGAAVINAIFENDVDKWTALVSAEPHCNTFPSPRKLDVPILIIKGGESHYTPEPCAILQNLYEEKRTSIELKIFPKSDHYFSYNGKVSNTGVAFNGCSKDPILIYGTNIFKRVDGTKLKRRDLLKCFTQQSAGGKKTREDLDEVIDITISFFEEHLRN